MIWKCWTIKDNNLVKVNVKRKQIYKLKMGEQQQLSGTIVVIIIAMAVQVTMLHQLLKNSVNCFFIQVVILPKGLYNVSRPCETSNHEICFEKQERSTYPCWTR